MVSDKQNNLFISTSLELLGVTEFRTSPVKFARFHDFFLIGLSDPCLNNKSILRRFLFTLVLHNSPLNNRAISFLIFHDDCLILWSHDPGFGTFFNIILRIPRNILQNSFVMDTRDASYIVVLLFT